MKGETIGPEIGAGGAWDRCGRDRHSFRHRVAHAGADVGDDRRQPAVGARLRRRLGSRLRGGAPHLRQRRRGLAGNLERSRRQLRVQGCPEQQLGRELRRERGAGWLQHRAHPRGGREREVLLRPRDPLGDEQQEHHDRNVRRQLPVRARLPGRLAARLPALLAPGSGRRRHLHRLDDRDPTRVVRGQGCARRELGRQLRAGWRPERPEPRVHRRRPGSTVLFSWNAATKAPSVTVTAPGGPTNRTPNNVEWNGVRHDSRATLYRGAPGADRRARGEAAAPDLPRRRHGREAPGLRPERERAVAPADDGRRERRQLLWPRSYTQRRRAATSGR